MLENTDIKVLEAILFASDDPVLEEDLKQAKKDVITGGDGRNSQELLEICRDSTDRELQTWNYIAKLIELDNKEEISNIEVLKKLIKINKNGE